MKCQACQRETPFTYTAEMWQRLKAVDTTPAYVCQSCQTDIGLRGGLTGKGWQWLQEQLKKRGAMPEVKITYTKDKTGGGVTRFEAVRSDQPSIYLTIEQSYRGGLWQVYRKLVDGADTYDIGLSREKAMQLAERLLGQVIGQEPGGKLIMGERVTDAI